MPEPIDSRRRLLIFTKPARPGRVKTRLIGDLSAAQAARLHEAFVGDVSHRLALGAFGLRMAWALDEGDEIPDFRLDDGRPVKGFRQEGSSLGDRLFLGLREAARAADYVAAVGSDHPSLPLKRAEEAFRALEGGADVVLGPAEDGGYYLVGTSRRCLHRRIFEGIEWSTEKVLDQTLDRCRELGLEAVQLPLGADVDTPDDLTGLARWLAENPDPDPCPRTRRLLEEWGRLPTQGVTDGEGAS